MTLIACATPTITLAIDCEAIEITPETKSKKAFAAHVEAHPDAPAIIEPAFRFNPEWGMGKPIATPRECIGQVVTNHPKRSWFGTITERKDGTLTVT